MKIVVIGSNGIISAQVTALLRQKNHEIAAVDANIDSETLHGENLTRTMDGARVVIDLASAPANDNHAAMSCFRANIGNLIFAAAIAGIRHYILLSAVGTERLLKKGHFRAKRAQEDMIRESGIPHTIIRSTQFFELTDGIAQLATIGEVVRLSPAHVQPVAADDVAVLLAKVALVVPQNGIIELAGPEQICLDDLVRRYLNATGDSRQVVTDAQAPYFGAEIDDRALIPGKNPHIGTMHFTDWLSRSVAQQKAHAPA